MTMVETAWPLLIGACRSPSFHGLKRGPPATLFGNHADVPEHLRWPLFLLFIQEER